MLNTPFSPWPSFSEEEAQAVKDVILSNRVNYWTGDRCSAFEQSFARFIESRFAISLANGTLALDLALKAIDIGPGDEVIVTPRTFLASVSSVVNAGAVPVFADVDLNSQNIEAHTIKEKITSRTKAVILVHLAGYPTDMDPVMALAKEHDFFVIEDCAQAHGAKYKGRPVGSIGDIGCWSFCQDKIMTTAGEGGMVTTNDRDLWEKMWAFKDHGKSYDAVFNRQHPPGFRWLHETFGSNFRMTEMQAVIGILQLKKMTEWIEKRRQNSEAIRKACAEFPLIRNIEISAGIEPAVYKHYCFINNKYLASGWSRDRIIEAIERRGVPCFQGSCSEVYLEKAFDGTGWRPEAPLPNAKELGETGLAFLVHPTLTADEISKTCCVIEEVLELAQVK